MTDIRRSWICWCVALFLPTALEWVTMSRYYDQNGYATVLGMIIGVVALALLPAQGWVRVVLVVAYIPLMAAWMFFVGVSLACGYYQSCL